jgi:iron complex outermembrane recepter protein
VVRTRHALLFGASALAIVATGLPAAGQTSTTAPPPQQTQTPPAQTTNSKPEPVEEVVVTGIRSSLRDSLLMKQSSDLITENISAKDIGQLPDITIAEELNTLPGVNATRDRGNDSQVNVRGLGPRLVLGLVNGEEIASSEPDQDIRWEIFPSEIVSGVTVDKTQSANLISGGIAGIVDIHTLAPLDYTGPSFTLRAGPTYNSEANSLPNYSPWGLRTSGAWVDKLTNNFAIVIGASFQAEKSGYTSFQGWGYNEIGQAGDNPPVLGPSGCTFPCLPGTLTNTPWGAQTELTEIQQDRTSVIANAQWQANSNLEFKFNNIFSHYNITENQQQGWYGNSNGWGEWGGTPGSWPYNDNNGTTYTVVQGPNGPDVVAANLVNYYSSVTNVIAHYNEDHTLFLSGLNGKWTDGDWVGTGDLSYSLADRLNRWQAIETEVFPPTMTFNTAANVAPSVTTPGYDPADPSNQPLQTYQPGESAGPEHTKDQIGAGQIDFTRSFEGSFLSALDFGARLSDRTKQHTEYQWYMCPGSDVTSLTSGGCPATLTTAYLPANELSEYTAKGFNVPPLVYGSYGQLAPQSYGAAASGGPPVGSNQLSQAWKVHETDFEAYVKTEFAHDFGSVPMNGDLGVRVVSVDSQSSGYEQLNGGAFTPISLKHDYTDVLPSLNMTFHLADDQLLHFAAAQAISRPPLDELRTGYSLNPTGVPPSGSGGNPLLNPYKDEQIDLSYEWYWHEESLLAIAPFFKHLDTFIGYETNSQVIQGVTYAMTAPFNGKGGDITGVELTAQSRFYFLPGILKDFGFYSNYSYVDSDVHEFTPVVHPFEATGFAKNTAEVDLWYSKGPFEARLAFKYHSPFTVIYGWNSQELVGLAAEKTLDFSTTYQWTDNIGLRFEAHNLTNQIARMYWNNDPNELARYDIFGRSYLLDITYHD